MAYYDALIAAWNNPTQPPPGVTGTGLAPGDTTQQKMDKVNAWTVVGTVPNNFTTPPDAIANCINYSEFKALTATQQSNLMNMLAITGNLAGGSANASLLTQGMLVEYFPNGTATFNALKALAKGVVQMWWATPVNKNGAGLSSPVSQSDLTVAGLS